MSEPTTQALDVAIAALEERKAKLARIRELKDEITQMENDLVGVKDCRPLVSNKRLVVIAAEVCCKQLQVRPSDMFSRSRLGQVAEARQVVFYLCRTLEKIPFKQIGEVFDRNHGTVIHGLGATHNRMDLEPRFRVTVSELVEECRARFAVERKASEEAQAA